MNRHLILAQSEATARALGAWLEMLGEHAVDDPTRDERVLRCRDLRLGNALVPVYRELVSRLDAALADSTGRGFVTVLVDQVDWSDLNATESPQGWARLVSLLILAFPDVRWVFGVISGVDPGDVTNAAIALSGLPSLFDEPHDPIFDGVGLRQYVCKRSAIAADRDGRTVAPWIPSRAAWCCAVDDEAMYAYLYGYVSYRNGFRAFPVSSQSLADRLLRWRPNSRSANTWGLPPPSVTIEDYYLGFPDKTTEHHLSRLPERAQQWPVLDAAQTVRCFVTSGHGRSQERSDIKENARARRRLRDEGRGGKEATKPTAGVFSLWNELQLKQRIFDGGTVRGRGPGYLWPWTGAAVAAEGTGHSAPGLLLLVAETLIYRAEQRVDKVCNVIDAVKGAVLALSAQELLGPMTPTTARDALELKHRFEALAECQFGGVQYNLDLRDRFDEIRRDMRLLGTWYGARVRGTAVVNGELAIVSGLLSIYKSHEEFEEEEACRTRVRHLQRQIWWRKRRRNPAVWLIWPLRFYIDVLLGSLGRLLAAIVLWIAALTLGFYWLKPAASSANSTAALAQIRELTPSGEVSSLQELASIVAHFASDSLQTFGQAIATFFGADPFASGHAGWIALSLVAMLSGFIHLGVFIAQLYTMMARR